MTAKKKGKPKEVAVGPLRPGTMCQAGLADEKGPSCGKVAATQRVVAGMFAVPLCPEHAREFDEDEGGGE